MGSYWQVNFECYIDDYGKLRWVATATDNEPAVVGEGRGHSMEEAALDLQRKLEERGR